MKFCGYVIKCDRIYISNRVVSACFKTIREYDDINDAKNELALLKSINSYLGFLCKTRSFNIQRKMENYVVEKHNTLYFVNKSGRLICKQKPESNQKLRSLNNIEIFINKKSNENRKI